MVIYKTSGASGEKVKKNSKFVLARNCLEMNVECGMNILAGKNETFCERWKMNIQNQRLCRVLGENTQWDLMTVSPVKQAWRKISKYFLGGGLNAITRPMFHR